MIKKLLLIIVAALALAGCGGTEESPTTPEDARVPMREPLTIADYSEFDNSEVNGNQISLFIAKHRDLAILVDDGLKFREPIFDGSASGYSNYGFILDPKIDIARITQTKIDDMPIKRYQLVPVGNADIMDIRSDEYVESPKFEPTTKYNSVLLLDSRDKVIGVALEK